MKAENMKTQKRRNYWNQVSATLTLSAFLTTLAPAGLYAAPEPGYSYQEPVAIEKEKTTTVALKPAVNTPVMVEKTPEMVLARVSGLVSPDSPTTLELGGMKLEFPKGAVEKETQVTIEELGSVAQLNPGLANASTRVAGYRALPHGVFKDWIKVTMAYDPEKVDTSGKRGELYTYFYNDEKKVWNKLERINVDEQRHVVESVTNHFTDFINGTLKAPETAKPLSFNPTAIKDIKAADPSAGVGQIEGLEANNSGSANFNLKLNLPPGRVGMMPSLALGYSSNGSSGWLGQGFDIGVPSITIDTRFGVPKFNGSDVYLLGGQPLVYDNAKGYYRTKVEGSFSRIKRLGGGDHQYFWTVEDTSGRVMTYGKNKDNRSGPELSKDALWMLEKTADVYGNEVTYSYERNEGQLYLDQINYTGYNGIPGAYYVKFLSVADRPDKRFEARSGYVAKMAKRLSSVEIHYGTTLVRQYKLTYSENLFGKSVLTTFAEQDPSGKALYKYGFDYIEAEKSGGRYVGFGNTQVLSDKVDNFSGSTSISGNAGVYAGLGAQITDEISAEVGVSAGISGTTNWDNMKLVDVSSDGIPDIVKPFMGEKKVYLGGSQPNIPYWLPFGEVLEKPSSTSWKWDLGVTGSVKLGPASINAGAGWSGGSSDAKWTYSDFDGDGKVDIVSAADDQKGQYFQNVSTKDNVSFQPRPYITGNPTETQTTLSPDVAMYYYPLDPLTTLSFPYSGEVTRDINIAKSPQDFGELNPQAKWDGVIFESYQNNTKLKRLVLNGSTPGLTGVDIGNFPISKGDRINLRVNSIDKTDNDSVAWSAKVRYTKIDLFEDLGSEKIPILVDQFDDQTDLFSESEILEVENFYTKVFEYSHYIWKLKANYSGNISKMKRFLFNKGIAGFVPKYLSVIDFKKFRFAPTYLGGPSMDFLGSYYTYNFVSQKMKLNDNKISNDTQLKNLHNYFISQNYSFGSKSFEFLPGITGYIDENSGVIRREDVLTKNLLTPIPGELGSRNLQNDLLIENIKERDNSLSQVWIHPHWVGGVLTVNVSGTGIRGGSPEAGNWLDNSSLLITEGITPTNSPYISLISNPQFDQSRNYKVFYRSPGEISEGQGYEVWGDKVLSALSPIDFNKVKNHINVSLRAQWDSAFVENKNPQDEIIGYDLVANISDSLGAFVLWSEVSSGLVDFGYLAEELPMRHYLISLTPSDPQEILARSKEADLVEYTRIESTLVLHSNIHFLVKTETLVDEPTDYVEILTYNGEEVTVNPVWIHRYDLQADMSSSDWATINNTAIPGYSNADIPLEKSVLKAMAGGGNHWYYSEWKGELDALGIPKDFDEQKILTQIEVSEKVPPANDPHIYDQEKFDTQVIWKMNHGSSLSGAISNGWIGRVLRSSETKYNSLAQSYTTGTILTYPFISTTTVKSFRVGGDGAQAKNGTTTPGQMNDIRTSEDSSQSFSAGAGVSGLESFSGNLSYNLGDSWGNKDLLDLNGDRLPDRVEYKKDTNQLSYYPNNTNANGAGFGFDKIYFGNAALHKFINRGVSIGGSRGKSSRIYSGEASPDGKILNLRLDTSSVSGGMAYSVGGSYKTEDLQDLNGDGLPDGITRDGLDYVVKVNNGTGFAGEQRIRLPESVANDINYAALHRFGIADGVMGVLGLESEKGKFLNVAGNSGVNLNLGGGLGGMGLPAGMGVSGSLVLAPSTNRSLAELMDINGDGLVDLVYKKSGASGLYVCFNQGDKFTEAKAWAGREDFVIDMGTMHFINPVNGAEVTQDVSSFNAQLGDFENPFKIVEEISSSTSFSTSAGVGGSFKFPIFWIFYGSVGLNLSATLGTSEVQMGLQDVDGDGMLDHVASGKNAGQKMLMVQRSTIGKVGLLKTIATPQGGSIDLEYARTPNSFDDPSGHWVLSQVTRSDNMATTTGNVVTLAMPDLPENKVTTQFTYENGYYERSERQFYGFGVVTTSRADGAKTTQRYGNLSEGVKDYWLKDQVYQVSSYDPLGNETSRQNLDRTLVDMAQDTRNTSKWVRVNSEISHYYENNETQTSEVRYIQYDLPTGSPKEIQNRVGGAIKNSIQIAYDFYKDTPYLAGAPTDLLVKDSSGNVVRHRTASYDENNGQLKRLDSYTDGSRTLYQTYGYDPYGNISSTIDNAASGVTIIYDPVLNTYPINVTDSHQQTSQSEYDFALGLETVQTDTNGKKITKKYDSFGRLEKVISPYDTLAHPALEFEYDQLSFPWKAMTHNKVKYDQTDFQTITTVILVDGMGRMVQTKKESEVEKIHGWSVSPWTVYDNLGREIKKGLPTFEPGISNTGLYKGTNSLFGGDFTLTAYDERDRVKSVTLPDGSVQTATYRLENVGGDNVQKVTSTDPMNRVKESTTDSSGQIIEILLDPQGKKISTKYSYDDLGQILTVKNTHNNKDYITRSTYDLLGRKISLSNPDSGTQTWDFDTNGDMVKRQDSNLNTIEYIYDKHRLMTIKYPKLKETNYVYGIDKDQNNFGRVISEDNGEVKVETTYGDLGEALSVKRTIRTKLAGQPNWDYTFKYKSNYLGQWESVTYPPNKGSANPTSEVVSYTYDRGGMVTGIQGINKGITFDYVTDATYDHYGQRTSISYGNGTHTTYAYNPQRRWLTQTETRDALNKVLLKQTYTLTKSGDVEKYRHETPQKTIVQDYTYDDLDQIETAKGSYIDTTTSLRRTVDYNQTFEYDNIGNLTQKTSTLNRSIPRGEDSLLNYKNTYKYDTTAPHRATQIGLNHYQYDNNGNVTTETPDWLFVDGSTIVTPPVTVTQRDGMDVVNTGLGSNRTSTTQRSQGVRFFTWDAENRLTKVQDDNMSVQYTYDQGGERRLKTLGTEETVYADRLYQVEGKGTDDPTGTINVYLGQERLASKLISEYSESLGEEGNNLFTYHQDHIGNSSLITDHLGRDYERTAFTPHGEMWIQDSVNEFDKVEVLFTGKAEDKETKFRYFGARYLNPTTGIWMSSDPALGEYMPTGDKEKDKNLPGMGGVYNPVNMALYHFAGNNSIKFVDPDGRMIFPVTSQLMQTEKEWTATFLGGKATYDANGSNTIGKYGCFFTSCINVGNTLLDNRVAGSPKGLGIDKSLPNGANVNIESNFNFLPGIDVMLKSSLSVVKDVSGITSGKLVETYAGPGTKMTPKEALQKAASMNRGFYVIGEFEGRHFVNIQGLNSDGTINIHETYGGWSKKAGDKLPKAPKYDLDHLTQVRIISVDGKALDDK